MIVHLRALLAFQALVAAVLTWTFWTGERAFPVALVMALLITLALDFALTALTLVLSRAYAGPTRPDLKLGLRSGVRLLFEEFLAAIALIRIVMPFESFWMGADDAGSDPHNRPPVLLAHGYVCNRGFWFWLRGKLRAEELRVATITFDPPFTDIDRFADDLHARIEKLIAETGSTRVSLVAHSMGGLVSRAYLRRYGAARVAQLITLGTPHNGTRIAGFGLGPNARQMRAGSHWLASLNAESLSAPTLAVWSAHDTIVAPQENARLPGAREIAISGLGHLAMAISPRILQILRDELAGDV